jgi:cbb3-type cytochrome oxidase subunit 3
MKTDVLVNFSSPWLITFAFFLFVFVFLGVVVLVFRRGSTEFYKEAERTPFNEGELCERK